MATQVKLPNRWIFVIAGAIINIVLGTIYAWSVFRPPLHKAPYNLTPAESTIPFSIFLLTFGISFAFAGRMVGIYGPRRPALIGAILLGVGYLLSYLIVMAPTAALYITSVTFGLIAGTGCGFCYNPPIATVGRWFTDRPGLALGLTVLGFGLSALLTAPLVVFLRDTYGIANTFLILGVAYLIILFALGSLLRFPPPEYKAPPPPTRTAGRSWVSPVDYKTREMTRTITFYVAWFIFLIGAGAGLMVIGNAAQIATDVTGLKGELAWMATLAVQILAIGNSLGRPVMGWVCDRLGPRNTLLIMLLIQLACLVGIFPYAFNAAILYAVIFIFGMMFGAYLAVMPTLVRYFFGAKNLGPNYGLYLSAYGVGGVVLPIVMATVLGPKPAYENYVTGFYVTAGFVVAGLILALILRPPRRPT
jgi:MFS family permease